MKNNHLSSSRLDRINVLEKLVFDRLAAPQNVWGESGIERNASLSGGLWKAFYSVTGLISCLNVEERKKHGLGQRIFPAEEQHF